MLYNGFYINSVKIKIKNKLLECFPRLKNLPLFLFYDYKFNKVSVCVGLKDLANDALKNSESINGKKILVELYSVNNFKLTTGQEFRINGFLDKINELICEYQDSLTEEEICMGF